MLIRRAERHRERERERLLTKAFAVNRRDLFSRTESESEPPLI
jgi:hypothetical protein